MMPDFQATLPLCPTDPPRFALRERVICLFPSEEGIEHRDEAFIVGVLHNPTEFLTREWVYIVAIYNFSHNKWLVLPHFDSAKESEIIRYMDQEGSSN